MTTRILAIDPGNIESAYAFINADDCRPIWKEKLPNEELLDLLVQEKFAAHHVAIEQIGHYGTGMPAGKTVFDTCRWIGRFEQVLHQQDITPELVLRPTVKAHLCGSSKAKDANVVQALIDRFAPDTPNRGKGSKAEPGWFYGFKADIWQAYALAVHQADALRDPPF